MIKIFVTKPSEKENFIHAMYTMEECPFDGHVPYCDNKSCTECFENFIEWHITSEDKPEGAEN